MHFSCKVLNNYIVSLYDVRCVFLQNESMYQFRDICTNTVMYNMHFSYNIVNTYMFSLYDVWCIECFRMNVCINV